ncbi:HEAT repeat protein [Paramyrothecium foliicola]|nr:HEAT repeat protein [Paramyrothecium foliicola]
MTTMDAIEVVDHHVNPTDVVRWVEGQDVESQQRCAVQIFEHLLAKAAQPKSVSGSACSRLSGFVEQASKAQSPALQTWAFSHQVTVKLFDFYVEWNESDQHRSMKLVLDLMIHLIKRNPNHGQAASTLKELLDNLVSIVIGRSSKPVVKSAIKTLDHFLTKNLITSEQIKSSYLANRQSVTRDQEKDEDVWETFFAELLRWLWVPFVCPIAGRFIVCLLGSLRRQYSYPSTATWHSWLLNFTVEDPSALEPIKNYIFLPSFKADKKEALHFLRQMNSEQPVSQNVDLDLDVPALLQLAALEVGKKIGLVEDPGVGADKIEDEDSSIVLHEKVLESVLAHPSHEVRALALSLLISSPSTTRPYSNTTFDLLRKHLGAFFADADAKFRVDVSSKARDMFKRVRGAISVLKRSIPRARAKSKKNDAVPEPTAVVAAQPITYRSNLIALPESQLVYCLDYHVDFLKWYMDFLCNELIPTASYQRHITSLKAVIFILRMESDKSKAWETQEDQEIFYDLFDGRWLRPLFDLVMDPFDDVRDASTAAIRLIFNDTRYRRFALFSSENQVCPAQELEELGRRAEELARRTSRADHSDGAARSNQLRFRFLDGEGQRVSHLAALINELDRKTTVAETDLGRAVLDAPLHSDFASLCYTWQVVSELKFSQAELEAIRPLQEQLVACCERAWSAVRATLCDDSPEGHIPQELEEVDIDTKSLLSYSFRAIHESSNLMRTILSTIKNRTCEGYIIPSYGIFERIGNLSFNQLASLRHRGAFTTVSATFAACCQQSKHLEDGETSEPILNKWYLGTLDAIFTQVSTTRRSAGIPSMMTGVLAANSPSLPFESVMERLMEIASTEARVTETDGSKLPQVHAFNCLKDIFKNSLLTSMGNKSEKYLPQCLELAASALKSEVWAIRNCGLIFLRSLIDCLFGSHERKSMIEAGWDGKANRIAYHRYPNLPQVLVNLLKSGHETIGLTSAGSSAAEAVFPALDIVRRAGPPDLLRDELQYHVAKYLASPVWHVRELAARTLCSCLLHQHWFSAVQQIYHSALAENGRANQNHVHGVLLATKFAFERLSEVATDFLKADLSKLVSLLVQSNIETRFSHCPEVVAAYLEVVNMLWAFQKAQSQALAKLSVSRGAASASALLKIQQAIAGIITASEAESPLAQLRDVLLCEGIGSDTLAAALEALPSLWAISTASDSVLSGLCDFYVDVCLCTNSTEAQIVAVQNLAAIFDKVLRDQKAELIEPGRLIELWTSLPLRPMNPALSNAVVRSSGGLFGILHHRGRMPAEGIKQWGLMMADAGLDDKGFDARFAAVESLDSFFAVVKATCSSEEYLPAVIALYDALNDDDDEIRDMASAAASHILGQPWVPIEAASRLLSWLGDNFGANVTFRAIVVGRIAGQSSASELTGAWEPAEAQISQALQLDDSLFAVEEQNLFVDEVRETERWISVFRMMGWEGHDDSLLRLDGWVTGGLQKIALLSQQEDGPLGWASNPDAFAVCARIVHAGAVMTQGHASADLRDAARSVQDALRFKNHASVLLMSPLVSI